MRAINSRSLNLYLLMFLVFFEGISGLTGGGALVLDPTGSSIQMSLSLLQGSPFHTFFIPGLILLTVLGIFPLVVFYGLWSLQSWSVTGALFVGMALIVWILVEISMIGYISQPPLQLVYGLIGVILLVLVLFGHVSRHIKGVVL